MQREVRGFRVTLGPRLRGGDNKEKREENPQV